MHEEKHQPALEYIRGLQRGDYLFHLPMLTNIEVTSAIRRRARSNRVALASVWKQYLADWERNGSLMIYPLDRDRMDRAVDVALRYGFRGQDAVFAGLAIELDVPIKTFDKELLERFPTAST